MELKHLRSFVAAVDHNGFTKASHTLSLTQAAVSQHIAALEREFDKLLFERHGRSVSLTGAGRRLYEYARRMLELADEATAVMAAAEESVSGIIRIAASTVPAEQLLPSILASFRETYPGVRESLAVSDSRAAAQAVEDGSADVGFVGEDPHSAQIVTKPVADDELVLVASASHAWSNRQSITIKQLRNEPLIVREPGSGTRRCLEEALGAKGLRLTDLNVVMEVNSNEAIRAAVTKGVGVAFLSAATVAAELDRGDLARIAVRGLRLERKLFLLHRPERLSRVAALFVSFVEQPQA